MKYETLEGYDTELSVTLIALAGMFLMSLL